MKLSALFLTFLIPVSTVSAAAAPIRNLSVTLRGKKFDVEEATTVQDILATMKEAAGVDGRILYGGRQLTATDELDAAGVKEGDSLQMVPATTKTKKSSSSSSSSSSSKKAKAATVDVSAVPGPGGMPSGMPDMSELLKGMGGPGGGGMPDMSELLKGGMPDISESMDMMANMMNSPIFQEYMSDPEKLEASRQMILQNPMMKSMMAGMPGMAEILENPDAWREAMTAAANLYKEMDPEDLKAAMMGNMPNGPGGDLSGLFGDGGTPSALDELSEGED